MAPAIAELAGHAWLERRRPDAGGQDLARRPARARPWRPCLQRDALGCGLQRRGGRRRRPQHPDLGALQCRAGRGRLPLSVCGIDPHPAAGSRPSGTAGCRRPGRRDGAWRIIRRLCALRARAALLRSGASRGAIPRPADPRSRPLVIVAVRGDRSPGFPGGPHGRLPGPDDDVVGRVPHDGRRSGAGGDRAAGCAGRRDLQVGAGARRGRALCRARRPGTGAGARLRLGLLGQGFGGR